MEAQTLRGAGIDLQHEQTETQFQLHSLGQF